ncbi:hypothetical protein O6P43_014029 [Quillaja saponaria]|uniref:Uncharacterized protein n=1 Tax=Quillaja saponaria TaxID=32244 RepID=A0AAD7PR99_QUISA|nr:hypothetical protein O6P43_014029 [Quillaja saponaria]
MMIMIWNPSQDHNVREDRSGRRDGVEFKPKSRDIDRRTESRSCDDEFEHNAREGHDRGEDKRSRSHNDDDIIIRSREGHGRKEDYR